MFRMVSYGLAMEKNRFRLSLRAWRWSGRAAVDRICFCSVGQDGHPWLQGGTSTAEAPGKMGGCAGYSSGKTVHRGGTDPGAGCGSGTVSDRTLRDYGTEILYSGGSQTLRVCGRDRTGDPLWESENFPRKHRVTVRDREVEMTTNEFEILKVLAEHEGAALSREEIAGMVVTDGRSIRPSTVRRGIESLRKKAGKGRGHDLHHPGCGI